LPKEIQVRAIRLRRGGGASSQCCRVTSEHSNRVQRGTVAMAVVMQSSPPLPTGNALAQSGRAYQA